MSVMFDEVHVETGARLHFGLLANSPDLSRQFGGAGLMIDRPGCKIHASKTAVDVVTGDDDFARGRVEKFLQCYRQSAPQDLQPPPCRLEVVRAIPPHVGFGSGTQLGLAVARALSGLAGKTDVAAPLLAGYVGRGLRSGLGIHGFETGGFLVDGGRRDENLIAPLVSRMNFPTQWRLLLMRPPQISGLSGQAEMAAFAQMEPMPVATTERLCRLLLMQILPAIADADFAACSSGLYEFGRTVGEYFTPLQGGIFASEEMRELATLLRERGLPGVGQTSWGPTAFALCCDEEQAQSHCRELQHSAQWSRCEICVARPLNVGANLTVH